MSARTPAIDLPDDARITGLGRWPRDPNFIRIEVAGRKVACLPDTAVEELDLAVDQAWTPTVAERVQAALERVSARRAALQALGRRGLTRHEVQERLARKGFRPEVVAAVTDDLVSTGWIDDATCAEETCRVILDRGPAAPALLLQRMARRGIDPDLARLTAETSLAATDPLEAAVTLAREKLARLGNLPPAGRVRRIASLLSRRGYDDQVVESAIHRLGLADGTDDG